MGDKTTRREFLKQMALTGAALSTLPGALMAAEPAASGKSRVVITTDPAVMPKEGEVSQAVFDKMVGKCVAKLTDSKTGSEAWKKLFKPSDVVGIKINCLFGKGVSTRPEAVRAVIAGLKLAGVDENNIIVWDRSSSDMIKSGYKMNPDGPGVKYFADDGQWGEEISHGRFKGHITKVISEKVTAFINMPALKTHGISGVSCCLKNHFGSFDNPGNHHANSCIAMADFSAIPVVKEKARLVIVDAVRPQHSGGPGLQSQDQWNLYSVMVSRDPVAADYHGTEIIQARLREIGKDTIPNKKLVWMQSAQEQGVGTCDPGKIELLRV
jgi:uncharacterized protein (DUF362 family)